MNQGMASGMGMAPGMGGGSQGGAPSFMSKGGSKAVTDNDDSSSQVGSLPSSSRAPELVFRLLTAYVVIFVRPFAFSTSSICKF